MRKYVVWGMILFSGLVTAATKDDKKALEKPSTENNSTEEQFNQSKSSKSWGTNNYNRGDRLVCESSRGQRQHCRADTSGGVRLIRQISNRSCRGHWGYDYYGVWVTNGCRGEFQIDRYQEHYGQNNNVVRCESYSYRRQTCVIDLNGADVELLHQLSNRSCRGNWGFNQNEIWVANGCKADFLISNIYNNNYGSGYSDGVVECRSIGSNIEHCQVPALQSIELIQELGRSFNNSCHGNWGYSSHGLWVRNGCHARFRIVEYQNHNNTPGFSNSQGTEVICESNFGQIRTCRADTSGQVELTQNLSNTSCNQRWGYDANGIWVKDGCRARFMTYPGNSAVVNPPVAAPLPRTIKCKSRRNNVRICDTKGPFRDVEFKREISKGKFPCAGNWGVNPKGELFVKNNCYAEFKIYY